MLGRVPTEGQVWGSPIPSSLRIVSRALGHTQLPAWQLSLPCLFSWPPGTVLGVDTKGWRLGTGSTQVGLPEWGPAGVLQGQDQCPSWIPGSHVLTQVPMRLAGWDTVLRAHRCGAAWERLSRQPREPPWRGEPCPWGAAAHASPAGAAIRGPAARGQLLPAPVTQPTARRKGLHHSGAVMVQSARHDKSSLPDALWII